MAEANAVDSCFFSGGRWVVAGSCVFLSFFLRTGGFLFFERFSFLGKGRDWIVCRLGMDGIMREFAIV